MLTAKSALNDATSARWTGAPQAADRRSFDSVPRPQRRALGRQRRRTSPIYGFGKRFFGRLVSLQAASVKRACSRSSILPFVYGPKRAMGHFLGAKKIIFLIRDIDGPAMAAALAESCQSVILRSPWGRLETIVDMCNRLRRTRGRFHR